MAVARLTRRGHLPGRDVQRGEQCRGAVAAVVVRAASGPPRLHRTALHTVEREWAA